MAGATLARWKGEKDKPLEWLNFSILYIDWRLFPINLTIIKYSFVSDVFILSSGTLSFTYLLVIYKRHQIVISQP